MSNSLFVALAILIVSGIVFYKSNEQHEIKTPIVKKYKKNKPIKKSVSTVVKKEAPIEAKVQPASNPQVTVIENVPTKVIQVAATTPVVAPRVAIPVPVLRDIPATEANDTFIEIRTNLSKEDKAKEIYKIAGLYRLQLEEIYKDKKLFYDDAPKISMLLSDTYEYILETDDYTKESDPAHIKELNEFIDTVYRLRDEGNQRVLQRQK